MADVTAANVTINRAWNEAGPAGRDLSCRLVTISCSASGGTTSGNQIPVATLSLTVLEQAGLFVDSGNTTCLQGTPNFAGTLLCFPDAASVTPANHQTLLAAAGVTGSFKGIVKGY